MTLRRLTPIRRKARLRVGADSRARRSRIKARNAKRQAKEFQRAYHSKERVEWVKTLPCIICRATPCENAHAKGDGAGRKGGYKFIVPMCQAHHAEQHAHGWSHFTRQLIHPDVRFIWAAAVEKTWLALESQHPTRRHGRRTSA